MSDLITLKPWTQRECTQCGCMHMATRTQERTVERGADLLCEGCSGIAHGRSDLAREFVDTFKRESQSASDKARVTTDRTKEGYAMAMRDALRIVQAIAEREVRHD